MSKDKIIYDYTRPGDDYYDAEWVNLITWEKELIRIPLRKRLRDAAYIPYHMSEYRFQLFKQMKSCKFPKDYDEAYNF